MPRILEKYRKEVVPALQASFGYKNEMQVPKITKVVVHVGTGRMAQEGKTLDKVITDISKITGQKPTIRKAKKSIAGFKLREGMDIGVVATLRGVRMYDFIDRLISVALPRSRDFQGLNSKSFDGRGNFNIGIKEHSIFPEVSYESLRDIFGLQVTIVTTAKTSEEGMQLLKQLGFPLRIKK